MEDPQRKHKQGTKKKEEEEESNIPRISYQDSRMQESGKIEKCVVNVYVNKFFFSRIMYVEIGPTT